MRGYKSVMAPRAPPWLTTWTSPTGRPRSRPFPGFVRSTPRRPGRFCTRPSPCATSGASARSQRLEQRSISSTDRSCVRGVHGQTASSSTRWRTPRGRRRHRPAGRRRRASRRDRDVAPRADLRVALPCRMGAAATRASRMMHCSINGPEFLWSAAFSTLSCSKCSKLSGVSQAPGGRQGHGA